MQGGKMAHGNDWRGYFSLFKSNNCINGCPLLFPAAFGLEPAAGDPSLRLCTHDSARTANLLRLLSVPKSRSAISTLPPPARNLFPVIDENTLGNEAKIARDQSKRGSRLYRYQLKEQISWKLWVLKELFTARSWVEMVRALISTRVNVSLNVIATLGISVPGSVGLP